MKFIISTAAAALLSTTAFAADAVYSYDSVPAPAVAQVPAYAWTGAYIGLNAGYGGGKVEAYYTDLEDPEFSGSGSITGNGFVGGAQAGYNWQSGSFVYGVETDIQYSGIEAETTETDIDGIFTSRAEIDWFGTTRARIGFVPTERFMAYATGGVAYGKIELSADGSFEGEPFEGPSFSDTRVGWTVGAGAEYAIDNNWSLKTEYLYTDLGKWTVFEDEIDRNELEFNFHTVRVGVNYKF